MLGVLNHVFMLCVGRLVIGIPSISSTGTPLITSSVKMIESLFIDLASSHLLYFLTAKIKILGSFISRWGTAYLTRDFFHNMGSKMGDRVLLVVAEEADELVAGALNLIGGDTIFGRLWGCRPGAYYPCLHFEACYYQVSIWIFCFISRGGNFGLTTHKIVT